MTWQKGESGNLKGRPKGVSNKITADLRAFIESFIRNNVATLQEDFDKLSTKERLIFLEKLIRYVVPILSSTNVVSDIDKLSDTQVDQMFNRLLDQAVKKDE
jgi:hypothetical protein